MDLRRIGGLAVIVLLFAACSGSKVLTTAKTSAITFETQADYIQATNAWKEYFNVTDIEVISGGDFAHAAKTAFKAEDLPTAKSWFDQARYKNYADAEMYEILAAIYEQEDNMSKELSALEYYIENFGSENIQVNTRLFLLYSEIPLHDKALDMWGFMDVESKSDQQNLEQYFNVNKALENNSVCDSVSLVLLGLNPDNIDALEWNAKKYYWAGQERYQREMEKYNKSKTSKNYKILLKELDLVTSDFKKALPYLEKLWVLNPGKEYAGYLSNIYALFGDKKKTNYYKSYRK